MDKEEKKRLRAKARKKRKEEAFDFARIEKGSMPAFIVAVISAVLGIGCIIAVTIREAFIEDIWTDIIGWAGFAFDIIFLGTLFKFRKKVLYGFFSFLDKITEIKGRKNKNTEKAQRYNKVWDLWAEEKLDDPIKYLLTYDSEVQNGGHRQYFDNCIDGKTYEERKEIFTALKEQLSKGLYQNLRSAYEVYRDAVRFNKDMSSIFEKYDEFYYGDDLTNETVHKKIEAFASTLELEQ